MHRTEYRINYKKYYIYLLVFLFVNLLGCGHSKNPLISNDYNKDVISEKIISFIGDSYVANHANPIEESWQYKLCVKYGCLYRNYGINGNPMIARTDDRGIPVIDRYNEIEKDSDIIIVIAGKNDYNVQLSITDFQKGVSKLCEGLKRDFPNSKIVFFTPWKIAKNSDEDNKKIKLQEYSDCIVNICNINSIPVFDVTRYSDIYMYDPDFRIEYCQGPNDVSHLNSKGHDRFLPEAEKFLIEHL